MHQNCRLDYEHKLILAPMVRIGTLPTRLLAIDFGADIVYSEELIDHKLLHCRRVENELLSTVDFVLEDGSVVFRTCKAEQDKVVLQMGTSDAERALKVAKLVENDVAAIDVNMGCPKEFSIKGGMGAALLAQPDKVKQILTSLVSNVNKPVTCKIRILPTKEETIKFCEMVQDCGISAIAVHGRLKEERPRHANHNDVIKAVAQCLHIPVIANGGSMEIKSHKDIETFKKDTGCSSVMFARAAQWNTSIFKHDGMMPINDVIKLYLKYAIDYDNTFENSKYCVQQMLHDQLHSDIGVKLKSTTCMLELCRLWDVADYLKACEADRQQKTASVEYVSHAESCKRQKTDIIELYVKFNKKHHQQEKSPKTILLEWTRQNAVRPPEYFMFERASDRHFKSVVEVNGQKFSSTFWEKRKKSAEQAAAIVCLHHLGVDNKSLSSSIQIDLLQPS